MSLLNVGSIDDSCNKQALETKLTQLKDTVTSLKIQNDRYKVTNANLNRCYEELSKANNHLRTTSLEKIAAQKAEISTLNAKTVGNKTSGTTKPANPKETSKPSPRFTKKPVAPLLKKPNVNVPLSTGIKSATGARKPTSKSNAWIYRKLPAKSVKGEKVEEHIRNLNKNNRVDSYVKRSIFVKNLNAVCGACHECLISFNHDNCLVYSVKSVNRKQPKAKNTVRTTKKVWRPKVVTSVKPMWKPTGWHFTLYDSYPLTRILEPTVEPIELSPSYDKDHLCPSCQLGKSKKASHPLKTKNTNVEVLSTLHMDLYRPMRTKSINKKKYVFVIVDDYTRFGWVRFLRTKDETPEVFLKFLKNTQRALNATVRTVRTDNGTELVNKTLTDLFESVGIIHQTSVPRSPQQNGVVKRRNRTLIEVAHTMLIFAKAPLFLWAKAVATACYTLNRSLIHTLHGKTYYELLKGKKPDLKYFRVFGSLCYLTNDYDDVGKLKAKANIGFFVGYAPTKKAYRVYNKRTRLKLNALQSGRTSSDIVKDPPTPSAPEIAIATPSTTLISEGAPAVTISPSVSESSPQDTSVHGIETPINDVDSNLYEPYIAPEAISKASSSTPVNADVTPNSPIDHVLINLMLY
nr:integrase, catalytic region, zinc finger, CCHC-type, peptidase aspartic, catalytic [Tanacetum cinerariifolium]